MEHIDSFEKVHIYNPNHYMIKIKIKDFIALPVRNWELNRPPDELRCKEIVKFIVSPNCSMDWLFYMIYENGVYKMIDGMHRYTALQSLGILDENRGGFDLVDINTIYENYVLVSLRITPSIGETIVLFQSLNKSVPIPELYIVPVENRDKRKIIEELTHVWLKLYPSHFTYNQKPNVPNINRDRFIDLLDIMYERYNINIANKNLLEKRLNDLNKYVMENIPPKTSEKALKKCNETGCYVFLMKKDVLEYIIKNEYL